MIQFDLDRNLSLLEQTQLLLAHHGGEPEYMFKHALVQDTAYATLLKQDWCRYHQRIGKAIEHANCDLFNAFIYMLGGEPDRSLAASRACVELASETGEQLLVNMAYGFRGWGESRVGLTDAAQESIRLQEESARLLGGQFVLPDQFAVMEAEVALRAGAPGKALETAERAVGLAKQLNGVFAEGLEPLGLSALFPKALPYASRT
jgi:hypothetical protein